MCWRRGREKLRVGLDLDYTPLKDTLELKERILKEQKANGLTQILIFQTKHGYHLELIYNRPVAVEEDFKLREKYGDCKKRKEYSERRYNLIGNDYDILFQVKEGFWRKRVW